MRTENLKLTTDMKVIRNEYQEVLNSMFTLERRNANLGAENERMKRGVHRGREDFNSLQERTSIDERKPL